MEDKLRLFFLLVAFVAFVDCSKIRCPKMPNFSMKWAIFAHLACLKETKKGAKSRSFYE